MGCGEAGHAGQQAAGSRQLRAPPARACRLRRLQPAACLPGRCWCPSRWWRRSAACPAVAGCSSSELGGEALKHSCCLRAALQQASNCTPLRAAERQPGNAARQATCGHSPPLPPPSWRWRRGWRPACVVLGRARDLDDVNSVPACMWGRLQGGRSAARTSWGSSSASSASRVRPAAAMDLAGHDRNGAPLAWRLGVSARRVQPGRPAQHAGLRAPRELEGPSALAVPCPHRPACRSQLLSLGKAPGRISGSGAAAAGGVIAGRPPSCRKQQAAPPPPPPVPPLLFTPPAAAAEAAGLRFHASFACLYLPTPQAPPASGPAWRPRSGGRADRPRTTCSQWRQRAASLRSRKRWCWRTPPP